MCLHVLVSLKAFGGILDGTLADTGLIQNLGTRAVVGSEYSANNDQALTLNWAIGA